MTLFYRPAISKDSNWLWLLRQQTMKTYISQSYGWVEADQYRYALDHLESASIIQLDGQDVGMVKLIIEQDKLEIAQLQVHPQYAGQGIGTSALTSIIERAKGHQGLVELDVLKNNPAQNLYKRLGFVVIILEKPFQYLMQLDLTP